MNISTHTGIDLNSVKHLLEDGEIVAIPTETVYGLAANALNEEAVLKIYEVKNRPQFNPLIIHVDTFDAVKKWVKNIPPDAEKLAKAFWPGPLTLLLDKNEKIPDLVTAGHSKVAIRVPAHPLTLELLNKLDFPLAAPSANPSGYVSPTTAEHVKDGLEGKIPYILDGGSCEVGLESTIIGWDESGKAVIYRAGGISKEARAQVLEQEVISLSTTAENPATPGMLKSHYATTTPLHAGGIEELINQFPNKKAILIKYKEYYPGYPKDLQYILTPHNNIQEAARNLFKILRAADQQNADFILAEYAPQEGLGLAINDRIERAKWEWKK
ncbi:MAG: L-threonylcarbamoyladenylate synthase [Bacteroidota bacterium]